MAMMKPWQNTLTEEEQQTIAMYLNVDVKVIRFVDRICALKQPTTQIGSPADQPDDAPSRQV